MKLYLLLGSLSNGDDTSHKKYSVQSRSSASRFAGVAILDEYQISSGGGGREGRSLLRRGLFVSWGGWGERKRERARHDGKGKERREAPAFSLFPFSRAHFLIFPIIAILIGIPSGSLCSLRSCPLPIIPLCLSWEEGLDFFLIG